MRSHQAKDIINRDVTHIHFEIRQFRNQQFLLTTASFPIFLAITSWILNNNLSTEGTHQVTLGLIAYALLLVVLWSIFYYIQSLHNIIVTLAEYPKIRNWSYWEFDYKKYTEQPYTSQTGTRATIFIILGLISFVCCLLSSKSLQWHTFDRYWLVGTIIMTISYITSIVAMRINKLFSIGEEQLNRWKNIGLYLESQTYFDA